jgi:hypothetical protein
MAVPMRTTRILSTSTSVEMILDMQCQEYDHSQLYRSPEQRTRSALAHLARVVIADLTEARGLPAELGRVVPNAPSCEPAHTRTVTVQVVY